ncbi:metallophosphoesterase, partial [Lapillicoccus sp.]|uniref:metallophosphoesterase family protein n=1 Tax=Lapillicoccus sp. TaxID=1909287 RepID=UPI0025DA0611
MRGNRWVSGATRVIRWFAMLAVCYVGGVAATNLAPTTIETTNYSGTVRLSPLPQRTAVLHSPTILGDIDLDFRSPLLAPGIEVAVSVKDNITSVFTSRNLDVATLQPSSAEISTALRDAATGVGWRFLSGAGTVALALALALHYARHRRMRARPNGRNALTVGAAVVVACGLTGGGIFLTYRPTNFVSYRTTGLLLDVERNRDVLQAVQDRSSQATPYVLNLLALSKSLQENLVPSELDARVSSRILLVSDVHGQNAYGLMKSIIDREKIDAVIDSGDLVNFGSATEADAAGIFTGIRSLGVPYVFVGGNHDFASPADRTLLTRLATVPNVVLLQPDNRTYTAYTLRGLRITGFNDPRYFGDDARNTDAKQKPAVDLFNHTMKDQVTPDVVVAHEPGAAQGADKTGLRINGHLHLAGLDGNRITVGTFTGGGVVSHYVPEEGSGELRGQPYAFDIAAFDTTCRLSSLTRFTYRNLIEGAPVYDNVTVLNGRSIEAEPVSSDGQPRSCGVDSATVQASIPAIPLDTDPGTGPGPDSTLSPGTDSPTAPSSRAL